MARKSDTKPQTIGFYGTGEVPTATVTDLLTDHFDGKPAQFLIPVIKPMTKAMKAVMRYAEENEVPFDVVLTEATSDDEGLKDLLDPARAEVIVKSNKGVGAEILKELGQAEGVAELFVLWSDDDSALHNVCKLAGEQGLTCRSVEDGLAVIEFEAGDTSAPDDEPLDETDKEPTAAGDDDDDDDEGEDGEADYTREELEEFAEADDLAGLKEILTDLGEELVPRQRTNTIIDRILEAQEKRWEANPSGPPPAKPLSPKVKEAFATVAETLGDEDDEEEEEVAAEVGQLDSDSFATALAEALKPLFLDLHAGLTAVEDRLVKVEALLAGTAQAEAVEGLRTDVETLEQVVLSMTATGTCPPPKDHPSQVQDDDDEATVTPITRKRSPKKRTPRRS